MAELARHFSVISFGMLRADALARDLARQLVQIQRQAQPLFTAHFAVMLNLKIQCRLRAHESNLTRLGDIVTGGAALNRRKSHGIHGFTKSLETLLKTMSSASPNVLFFPADRMVNRLVESKMNW